MMNIFVIFFSAMLFLLSGCQTNPSKVSDYPDGVLEDRTYSVFSDQGDHLEALVRAGKFKSASMLFDKYEEEYFLEEALISGEARYKKYSKQLTDVANYLNGVYEHELEELYLSFHKYKDDIVVEDWSFIKELLGKEEVLLKKYLDNKIFKHTEYRSKFIDKISSSSSELKRKLVSDAPSFFLSYNHSNGASFFLEYPIELKDSEIKYIVESNDHLLSSVLSSVSFSEARSIVDVYNIAGSDNMHDTVLTYVTKYLDHELGDQEKSIEKIIYILNDIIESGIRLTDLPERYSIGVVVLNGKPELSFDNYEFVTRYKQISELVDSNVRYAIVIDGRKSSVKREVVGVDNVSSQYNSGYENVPNPRYSYAQSALQNARDNYQRGMSEYNICREQNTEVVCERNIYGSVSCSNKPNPYAIWTCTQPSKYQVNNAYSALQSTPRTIRRSIYSDYEYDITKHKSELIYDVVVYLIDLGLRKYNKYKDISYDDDIFDIPSGFNKKDKHESIGSFSSEESVINFEKSVNDLYLDDIADIVTDAESFVADGDYEDVSSFVSVFDLPINQHSGLAVTNKVDDRFNSVVLIETPHGKGAGFYVSNNMIITNQHVIDDSTVISVSNYSNARGVAEVEKVDILRDLALLTTDLTGTPVALLSDTAVVSGVEVQAIGHPKEFNFSLTNGVVSSLRKMKSLDGLSSDKFLYVQTDAPINPGNSGGALFFGNSVIGINTFKRSESEGIGFALHATEIIKFLDENFISPSVTNPAAQTELDSNYLDELTKLKRLLDDGVIDEQDYNTLKQKIIDKL